MPTEDDMNFARRKFSMLWDERDIELLDAEIEKLNQKVFVLEKTLEQKQNEVNAYKETFKEQQRKAEYYYRIVKWYRRNRA